MVAAMRAQRPWLVLLAAAWSGSTAAAHAKLKLRLAASSASVQLPATDSLRNGVDDAQRFSTTCRANERAISPGRHIVGQPFGPSAVGGTAYVRCGRPA